MEAERPVTTDPKKISFVADQLWACAWYRCHVPGMELQRRGHEVVLYEDVRASVGHDADVFVVQATVHPELLDEIVRLKARGKLTVYDIDDDPFALHSENPGHHFWGRPDVQEMLIRMLRAVDVVTTTTPELAETLQRFNRNVVVLPNMLPSEHWPTERMPAQERDPLVVGWAGSSSHAPDLREIHDLLLQLLERYPHVQVHLAGARPEWFRTLHPRLKFLEPVRIEQYATLVSGFDIALAPLADTRFNRAKSDLKLVEYGMIGLPVIASKVPSYARFLRNGDNGFLAASPKDWLQRMSALVEDVELRDRLGAGLRRAAQNRVIERHIRKWETVYGIER